MVFVILNHKGFGLFNHQKRKSMERPGVVFVVMVFTKTLKDSKSFP